MYTYYFHYKSESVPFYHRFQLRNRYYILTNQEVDLKTIDHKDILIQISNEILNHGSNKIEISKRRKKETNVHISFNYLRQLFAVIHSNFNFEYYISYEKI